MSRDAVMRFFEAIRAEEEVVRHLRPLEADLDAFARLSAELGRARGFSFDPSEVREVLDAVAKKAGEELSDRELSAVAGGGWTFNFPSFGCRGTLGPGKTAGCMTTAACHEP